MEYIFKLSVYLMKLIPIFNISVKFISMKCQFVPGENTIMFHFYFFFLCGQHVYLWLLILLRWLKFTGNMQSKLEGQGLQEMFSAVTLTNSVNNGYMIILFIT